MLCTANYKLINLQIKNMKSGIAIVFIAVLLIGIFSCKKEDDRVETTDERLLKEWQLDSMKVNNNILSRQMVNEGTMFTNGICSVVFFEEQQYVEVYCDGESSGTFKVFKDNLIEIKHLVRVDRGGWETTPWLLLVTENLNNSKSYIFTTNHLIIKTENNNEIYLSEI